MQWLFDWWAVQQHEAAAAWENTEALLGGSRLLYVFYAWLFAAVMLSLCFLAWQLHYRRDDERGVGAFLRFVFPKRFYLHLSSWVDVQFIVMNHMFSPLSMVLAALLSSILASGISYGLTMSTGIDPRFEITFLEIGGFTLALAAASDFGTYCVHRLHHSAPALWEIHKVHHSAEVLTPLTAFRKHPLYDLSGRLLKVLLVGPLQGLIFFLFAGPVSAIEAVGVNLVVGAFHLIGGSLHHSHVWLSYGRFLNRVFISPAQHQIHHSKARRHWDRNYGEIFAVWDWLFGTLYVPRGFENLEFGIDEAGSHEYSGLWGALGRPVRRALTVRGSRRAPPSMDQTEPNLGS